MPLGVGKPVPPETPIGGGITPRLQNNGAIMHSRIVPKIVAYEREVRTHLLDKDRLRLEDKIWRALGTLRVARSISSEETMDLLSSVRLGVNLGLLSDVDIETVNELFILTQPAHLQKLEKRELEPLERDVTRAEYIRDKLGL